MSLCQCRTKRLEVLHICSVICMSAYVRQHAKKSYTSVAWFVCQHVGVRQHAKELYTYVTSSLISISVLGKTLWRPTGLQRHLCPWRITVHTARQIWRGTPERWQRNGCSHAVQIRWNQVCELITHHSTYIAITSRSCGTPPFSKTVLHVRHN